MTAGRLITLEGIEGAGKSTVARLVCNWLRARGLAVRLTREPGGTPLAERVRGVVLERGDERISPVTETLLMPIFCRWLGMRVGQRVEMSDATGFQPDLVAIGDRAMLADVVVLGAPVIHRGLMTLGEVSVGERSFLGNGSQVPLTTIEVGAGSLRKAANSSSRARASRSPRAISSCA